MFLLEGAKVSKQIIDRAMRDPSYTMGIEVEFLLLGAQSFLTKYQTQDLEVMNQGGGDHYVKRLGDFNWGDALHFLQPFGISQYETKDNIEVMRDRLEDAYTETFEKPKVYNYSRMWEELKQQHRVHVLLAMMRIFPEHRVMQVPEGKLQALRSVVYDGNMEEMMPFGKVNDLMIATAEKHWEKEEYDISANESSRAAFYTLVAEDISRQLGVNVTYSSNSDAAVVKQISGGYTSWVVTSDSSLDKEEIDQDAVGCELVSPIMPVAQGIQMLDRVLTMMQGEILGLEVVTTENTGLHVNLGAGGREVDALKLLVLLGDEHILNKFDRMHNVNTQSARRDLSTQARAAAQGQATSVLRPQQVIDQVQQVLSKMHLEPDDIRRLMRLLNDLKPEGKSWSVNFMKLLEGYVEFRAIGNADYQYRKDDILQAIYQMLMVVVAATDPSVYRKEFLKKLYQMAISPQEPQQLAASVGPIGHQAGMPGGFGPRGIDPDPPTPYDGENFIQYGFDPGSNTQ